MFEIFTTFTTAEMFDSLMYSVKADFNFVITQ